MKDDTERLLVLVRNRQQNIKDAIDYSDPFTKGGNIKQPLMGIIKRHLDKGYKVELSINKGR